VIDKSWNPSVELSKSMKLFNENTQLQEFRKKQGNDRSDKMREYLGTATNMITT